MARRPIWHDDYWLLLIKLFLKRPQGVKRLYSKDLVDVALELHLHPTYIHRKLMQLRSIDTPRLQRMWDRYATSPRRLSRGIALLRQMKGFGNADAFFAGVTEETETWEKDFQPIAFTLPDGKPNTSLTPAMLIMILDLYFRLTPLTMVPETPEVQELAKLMRINPTQVAEELAPDAAYFEALHRLQMPDERVGQEFVTRLSRQVDQWNAVEKSSGSRARRMSLRVVGMVAASLLLLFSLGMYLNNRQGQPAMMVEQRDTFNNPEDAAAAAGKALAKFSSALNKGLDKVNNVNQKY